MKSLVEITTEDMEEMFSSNVDRDKIQLQMNKFNRCHKSTKQSHGFNTSKDKDTSRQNYYLMTEYISSYKTVVDAGVRRRVPVYKPIFNSLDEAFYFIRQQRQVFTGLNHKRRDIVVIDIDETEEYAPCFTEEDFNARISYLNMQCDFYSLPQPSYIEFHKDSGHCQAGWYLSEYFINYGDNETLTAQYKYLSHALSALFHTDECFRGGNIKNPYNANNIAFFQSRDLVDSEAFLTAVRLAITSLQLDKNFTSLSFPETSHVTVSIPHKSKSYSYTLTYGEVNGSRNVYALKQSTRWIFKYMREHNGYSPSIDDVIQKFTEFEYESLPIVGKSSIESYAEIRSSSQGVLSFCRSRYNSKIAAKITESQLSQEIQDKKRYFSKVHRQLDKALKSMVAQYMRASGNTQKVIAAKLNCTQANVSILLKQDIEKSIIDIRTYWQLHEKKTDLKTLEVLKSIKDTLAFVEADFYEVIYDAKIVEPEYREIAQSYTTQQFSSYNSIYRNQQILPYVESFEDPPRRALRI